MKWWKKNKINRIMAVIRDTQKTKTKTNTKNADNMFS